MNVYLPIVIAFLAGLFAIYQVINYTSNYQLKWIEGFRESVSKFISEVNEYSITMSKIINNQLKTGVEIKNDHPDMIRFYNSIKNSTMYSNQLLLYLDPNKKNQKDGLYHT